MVSNSAVNIMGLLLMLVSDGGEKYICDNSKLRLWLTKNKSCFYRNVLNCFPNLKDMPNITSKHPIVHIVLQNTLPYKSIIVHPFETPKIRNFQKFPAFQGLKITSSIHIADKCILPTDWSGLWFESGVRGSVSINTSTMLHKGKCLKQLKHSSQFIFQSR